MMKNKRGRARWNLSKKGKGFSLRSEFFSSLKYLKESQSFIWGSAIVFIVSIILGYFLHAHLGFYDNVLKEMIEKVSGLTGIRLIVSIFWNNLFASFLAIVLGIVLGIFPVLFNVYNGLMIGYVIKKVSMVSGLSEMWRLFPHGIFEIPAIMIAFGLGVRLGWFFLAKDEGEELRRRVIGSIRVFLFIILILIIVAAIIEGTLMSLS